MRCLWLALALSLSASVAEAQVQQGSFKLSIDTDVLNIAGIHQENSETDFESDTFSASIGPGGSTLTTGLPGIVGLSFGYAVHPHVIPQLHFAFSSGSGSTTTDSDQGSNELDAPNRTTIMLRPEAEIPFNPESRVVVHGLVGFDLRHASTTQDANEEQGISESESSITGFGPVLGAGLHIFVIPEVASIDVSAQFSYLVFSQSAEVEGEEVEGLDDVDMNAKVFSINAGLSLWP